MFARKVFTFIEKFVRCGPGGEQSQSLKVFHGSGERDLMCIERTFDYHFAWVHRKFYAIAPLQ
jgi:hypothetical protein